MGNFAPVFLAFLLNRYGVYIFREPTAPCIGPLLSFCIFLISVFILLWDMRLYPKSLRKLWRCGYYFLEFLIADFIMEHLVSDFWFPLETAVLVSIVWTGQTMEETLDTSLYTPVVDALKSKPLGIVASYCLSIFFLIAVLHATRAIDLRLVEMGPGSFFRAILFRLKRGVRKIVAPFTGRRKVDLGASIDDLCGNIISDEDPCDGERHAHEREYTSREYGDDNCGHKRDSPRCGHYDYKQPAPSSPTTTRRRGRRK